MINKNVAKSELFELYYEIKKNELFKDYILGGGTALALQLGHRTSTDIDLFTANNQNNKDILNELSEEYNKGTSKNRLFLSVPLQFLAFQATKHAFLSGSSPKTEVFRDVHNYYIISISNYVLEVVIKNIKLDFIKDKSNIIETPKTEGDITYFSIRDISAMKLRAILTRTKSRDFIDIAYIMQNMSLNDMFENYKLKYKSDDISVIKIALLKSKHITKEEWEKDIHMLKSDIKLDSIPKLIETELMKYNKKHNMGNKNTLIDNIKKYLNKNNVGK